MPRRVESFIDDCGDVIAPICPAWQEQTATAPLNLVCYCPHDPWECTFYLDRKDGKTICCWGDDSDALAEVDKDV